MSRHFWRNYFTTLVFVGFRLDLLVPDLLRPKCGIPVHRTTDGRRNWWRLLRRPSDLHKRNRRHQVSLKVMCAMIIL